MGMDTNELDTREEDLHRTNKTLCDWEEEENDARDVIDELEVEHE